MSDSIDSIWLELSDDMKQQFMACADYFLEKKGISFEEFQSQIALYEREFLQTWNIHKMLLDSGDECYGNLNQGN